jgi:hypothetical protein
MISASAGYWHSFKQSFAIFGPLMTIQDIINNSEQEGFTKYHYRNQEAILKVAAHVVNFLAHSNPHLGRSGNVCPYISDSLQKKLCRVTATDTSEPDEIAAAMKLMRDVFRQMPPSSCNVDLTVPGEFQHKAIIVAFSAVPTDRAEELIGGVQKRLKPQFVRAGLMIGEFYPTCQEPGLHNPNFRPLQMPVPALAIRHITKFDAPFMLGKDEYVDTYVSIFGKDGESRINQLRQKLSSNKCPVNGVTKWSEPV